MEWRFALFTDKVQHLMVPHQLEGYRDSEVWKHVCDGKIRRASVNRFLEKIPRCVKCSKKHA